MTPTPYRSVIPLPAAIIAAVLAAISFIAVAAIFFNERTTGPFILLALLIPVVVGAYVLAVGYIYGDARRRGMRYVMWTLLAIFVPNGLGIILYFLLRDPLPVYCSRCGRAMQSGFAFCPGCGANYLPSCGSCGKTMQVGWTHCAWCGHKL